ncbi:restriction endonuclease subunit S, partial [Avibacterium avium]|uniref:restriction endonuclease subunit S n=1 Tax=Avibacterium avium TaxID=751 RepID=UPI003BF7ADF4
MSEWKIQKLSEVADIIGGGTPSSKENSYYDNGNIPWITPKDLSNYNEMYISRGERNITELGLKNSSAKLLPKGSVLFSSRAPIGYIAIARNELSTNQGFKSLVLKNGHIPEFYYYLLKDNVAIFEARASGSTFKEVSGQVVKDTELNIPDTETQKNIVNILKPLDDKITLNTQTNQTLEQIAQGIFKHWFIDFTPVHAKANALARGETTEQAEL